MKYYLYISQTKVEMLHGQIATTRFSKIKAALTLKIPFLEASLNADNEERSLYAKAEQVRNQLMAEGHCGSIEHPKSYVDDTANLSLTLGDQYSPDLAVFGGTVGSKKVALIGSVSSLVGCAKAIADDHSIQSYEMRLLRHISCEEEEYTFAKSEQDYADQLERSVDSILIRKRPRMPIAFVAKVLHSTPQFLVGSPIIVAGA